MPDEKVIVIIYTTLYRKGGSQFPVVARTLASDKAKNGHAAQVLLRAVESKRDVLQLFSEIRTSGKEIIEFHFVGHSGMYGPMFGTVAFPEQFSPYEWETLEIPFNAQAAAYFHCCRSARWFAPFFSRTFGVKTHGYFWYTTFSRNKNKYRYAGSDTTMDNLYTIGCKGRRSHGISASVLKFLGLMPAEEMKVFSPTQSIGDATYNHVAELYDEAFADIQVRRDEWNWLSSHVPEGDDKNVLDIGCGNGALLNALSEKIVHGVGVDESEAILERARKRTSNKSNLEFIQSGSPILPFADASFDVVISLMSFRYLDWDPLLKEIKRVSKPGARFLVVDMVTDPVTTREYVRLVKDKTRTAIQQKSNSTFDENLRRLVTHPDWKRMLEYNPIRSEHEMKWYLESRFPGRKMETLNLGWHSRIVAFDSGPVEHGVEVELSFP